MKTAEVLIGATYVAKVSGALVPVRITNECAYGGWFGVNTKTNREVRIRTAQRLRQRIGEPITINRPRPNQLVPFKGHVDPCTSFCCREA